MNYFIRLSAFLLMVVMLSSCSDSTSTGPIQKNPPDSTITGSMPDVIAPDITITMPGTKISQLVGDYDREEGHPTLNKTYTRYELRETDLGMPFRYNERTYILFGDTHGGIEGNRDAMAYTTDTNPEDGLRLHFLDDNNGIWKPITIPGISQGAFEVPMEGVEVNDEMYIYHTTNHSPQEIMGRSVIARRKDEAIFQQLYTFSTIRFINISVVKTSKSNITSSSPNWDLLPENRGNGEGLVIFGSGTYRESNVYLAYQPTSQIENPKAIRYFSGVDEEGNPLWNTKEFNAMPLFDQPCVGEFSVTYNTFIDRWILLYNCSDPRGINLRTAKHPWEPWTEPQVLFEPWEDGGYCHFMHTSWESQKCDSVMDPGRQNVWGGEYGPYQYGYLAKGDDNSTTIYFNMSTWNPYTVVLMKAKLERME